MPTDSAMSRNGASAPLLLPVAAEALRPLIAAVVVEVLDRIGRAEAALPERLAFGEAEAARLLSLHVHQLRDERLRGRIKASIGPGRKILYCRQDLCDYLAARRWEGNGRE